MTADAANCPVVAGPIEATPIRNRFDGRGRWKYLSLYGLGVRTTTVFPAYRNDPVANNSSDAGTQIFSSYWIRTAAPRNHQRTYRTHRLCDDQRRRHNCAALQGSKLSLCPFDK